MIAERVRAPRAPLAPGSGRGIVMCAGGLTLAANAWVALSRLRRLSRLPVEIFHVGDGEMPRPVREGFRAAFGDVTFRDLADAGDDLRGFQIKPHALALSRFREVVLLDADNMPLLDPDALFGLDAYRATGALFWPDVAPCTDDSLYVGCGLDPALNRGHEVESGQMVIDRGRCAAALQAVCALNGDALRPWVYARTAGDAGTFRVGFHVAGAPFAVVGVPAVPFGADFLVLDVPFTDSRIKIGHRLGSFYATGLLQHLPDARPAFAHRTVMEWLPHVTFPVMTQLRRGGRVERAPALRSLEREGYADLHRFLRLHRAHFPPDRRAALLGVLEKIVLALLDALAWVVA